MIFAGTAVLDLTEGTIKGTGGVDAEMSYYVVGLAVELWFRDIEEIGELLHFLISAKFFHIRFL